MGNSEQAHWSQMQEAGTVAGMRFLYWLYRIFGRPVFSLVMYPVALYFVLFRAQQRNASLQYLRANHAYQVASKYQPTCSKRKPNYISVLIHFKHFAEVILDKLLGWLIDIEESDFVLSNQALVNTLLNDSRGQLIVGSHFGNLEFCRGFMQRYKSKVINILLYDKHAGNFVKIMQKENADSRLNVFQVDEFDVTTIMMLKEKVAKGEWVFIAGDRVPLSGLERTVDVNFLGKPAPLPIGPYMLAKALACPMVYMFAYRDKTHNNKVFFDVTAVCDSLTLSRKNKLDDITKYAQLFADKLQQHSLRAPYQWFNFYNFWQPQALHESPNHRDK
ncbi:hypothetical protein ACFO4O_16665 [Glaciecola siphonariae]|uniref:Acyltransferase n=1 Tax=Glaciecola siphonariae TaxID=521012 RepID=A0ABV9LYX8_9ALTE